MKKRKRGLIHLRFRKGDPAHNLLAATQHWVKANGGNVIVIGGIGIHSMNEANSRFRVTIGCLGRQPKKSEAI